MIYIAHFKHEFREKDADLGDEKTMHEFNVCYFTSFQDALAYVRKFHDGEPVFGFKDNKWKRESISITETKNGESSAEAYKALSWENGEWGCMTLKVYGIKECNNDSSPKDDIEQIIYD